MTTTFSDLCHANRKRNKGGRGRDRGRDDAEARRVESAFHAQTAPLLSAEEELALAARIKAGDRAAREALTLANMRLVVNIATQFKPRGMELDDLIQEGNLGLMRATEDFDPEAHGTRFSTYAACWIRNYIMRATSGDGSMIHLPYYLRLLRQRFDRAKAEMMGRGCEANAGRGEPTMEDVAEEMGIAARKLPFLRKAQVGCLSYSTSSLEAEGSGASEDLIFEERPPEKPLEVAEEMEQLHAALGRLTPFEAWLIRRRYRIDEHAGAARASDRPRSRPSSRRDELCEAKRIKRANEQADEPRAYRELERECGLGVHRLKRIERDALAKLNAALSEAPVETLSFPSEPPPRRARRRATA
jgi:RNA polymerase primary sigma factor